jgi:uncharacterized membrane protein
MSFAKAYLGTILPFLIIDAVWIRFVVSGYYQETVGHLLLDTPNFVPAGLFYLAYAAGIVVLAVRPAIAAQKLKTALINGGILGAIAYGTFTLTNYSVLQGWTTGLVISDILWGTFLTGLSAGCGYLFARGQATPTGL